MRNRPPSWLSFALPLVMIAGVLAWAAPQPVDKQGKVPGYKVNEVVAAYRPALAAADPIDFDGATILALPSVGVEGFQNVIVHGRFNTASATVVVKVIRLARDGTIQGRSDNTTLTAGTGTVSSLFLSPTVPFDTVGSAKVKVIIELPSAGTVDIWVEVS